MPAQDRPLEDEHLERLGYVKWQPANVTPADEHDQHVTPVHEHDAHAVRKGKVKAKSKVPAQASAKARAGNLPPSYPRP